MKIGCWLENKVIDGLLYLFDRPLLFAILAIIISALLTVLAVLIDL